eukprot:8021643-Alexandrium_andersonii.AAC.1
MSVRWEASSPTSLPTNADWRSDRALTVRATSARKPATRRPCSSWLDWGSCVGLKRSGGSAGRGVLAGGVPPGASAASK